jgi:AAA domain, putative AbiEii toxin, Type IV TA system
MTLIDVAWRIYMFSKDKAEFVVLMDEPENHLHPSMQRTLMRRLLSAFPKAQFIIATHSPFMVSSVRDSNVYVLRYLADANSPSVRADVALPIRRKVVSEQLSLANKASTAGEVLREVLGVPATMPEWVEEDLDGIIQRYRGKKLSSELLDSPRRELTGLGFDEYYPDALAEIARPQ